MNSNQRRKDKRKWKYHVAYEHTSQERYDQMWDWCVATFGNHIDRVWREKHGHVGDYWQFEDEQSMTLFVMKFGASDR